MTTLELTNGDKFDLHVRVYDLNSDKYTFIGVINPGDSRDGVDLQEDTTNGYVHYHWCAFEARTDKSKAWHGAGYVDGPNQRLTITLESRAGAQLGATCYPAMRRPPP